MKYQELIETLTYLKENRKLGSEADALVAPFKATVCPVRFRFESMSRTFANPHDPAFEGGQTVVGEIIGENLEFSLLLPPVESEWAESLEKGEQFDGTAKFLGFDGLYQRGIFGYQGELEVEENEGCYRSIFTRSQRQRPTTPRQTPPNAHREMLPVWVLSFLSADFVLSLFRRLHGEPDRPLRLECDDEQGAE